MNYKINFINCKQNFKRMINLICMLYFQKVIKKLKRRRFNYYTKIIKIKKLFI
jgi:hypothetical protein